jgi:hypothetical protein
MSGKTVAVGAFRRSPAPPTRLVILQMRAIAPRPQTVAADPTRMAGQRLATGVITSATRSRTGITLQILKWMKVSAPVAALALLTGLAFPASAVTRERSVGACCQPGGRPTAAAPSFPVFAHLPADQARHPGICQVK